MIFLNTKNKYGFSLLELIIYIAILASFLVIFSGFFSIIINISAKEKARIEVQQNLTFAVKQITNEVYYANNVVFPVASGDSDNSLSLNVDGSPVQFNISGNVLQKTKDGNTENITSDNVKVGTSSNIFKRIDNVDARPTIQIILTISYNDNGRPIYKFSETIQTTVSLREQL